MYIPDRVIVRKIKEYDPHLFVQWNNEHGYFELWRSMPHGRRMVTPVVGSLYDANAPKAYVPLDERILWWLVEADGWRLDKPNQAGHRLMERWARAEHQERRRLKANRRDLAKDSWLSVAGHFTTKHAAKNSGRPNFNKARPHDARQWTAPDVQARTSPRLFSRSRGNALKYGFRG